METTQGPVDTPVEYSWYIHVTLVSVLTTTVSQCLDDNDLTDQTEKHD